MKSPLTGSYSELRRKRAQRDPEFRRLMLIRAIKYLNQDDLVMGKSTLYNFIDATIGFSRLGRSLRISASNLRGMLNSNGKLKADDLVTIVQYLKKREGIEIEVSYKSTNPVRRSTLKATRAANHNKPATGGVVYA